MKAFWQSHALPLLVLLLAYLLTTVPFFTLLPLTHDSAQLVLGVRNFDVSMHQPHPPGYPLFIAAGKLLAPFLSEHSALLLVSSCFGVGAVILLYLLVWEVWAKKWLSLLIAMAFLVNPLFWFYRELALTYTVDACGALLVGLLACRALSQQRCCPVWAGLALGLVGGFRPSLILLMAPLLLCPALWNRDWRRLAGTTAFLAAGCLIWYVPLISSSGGMAAFHEESSKLFTSSARASSIIFGAPSAAAWSQIDNLCVVLLAGLSWMGIPFFLALAWSLLRAIGQRGIPWKMAGMGLAWAGPPLFMYGLIHFGRAGYVLILLPGAYLVAAQAFLWASRLQPPWARRAAALMLAFLPTAHAASFLLLSPCCPQSKSTSKLESACRRLGSGFDFYASLNADALRMAQERLQTLQRVIHSSPAAQTLVIGGHNVEPDPQCIHRRLQGAEPFRALTALAPEYRILYLPAPIGGALLEAHENRISYLPPGSFAVPEGVRRVVLTVDGLGSHAPQGLPVERRVENGQTYFEGAFQGEFSYLGVRFLSQSSPGSQ